MLNFIRQLFSKKPALGCGRARGRVVHRRPTRWLDAVTPDPESYVDLFVEEVDNLITNAGRDQMHAQGYVGFDAAFAFIALSNSALTETATSSALLNEIVANGLSRAIYTAAHTAGTNTTTLTKTFTCITASQAAQKAALFTAVSAGIMNHVLAFTQRTLLVGDQLAITFTITIG
jgi:hypothetical protein